MTAEELRKKYIEFFRDKEHSLIPSASLVPENDPTVLFTTAGMHPLVPYLLGEEHPAGSRLVSCQRCIRTNDIDLVGDDYHLTFFEMLGNWSLGDYFKSEAIEWSWEFLTNKKWLGLDPERICVSVFAGDETAKRDEDSADIWKSVGVSPEHIFYFNKSENWWGPAGQTGPCGPDTEMFYDTQRPCTLSRGKQCDPSCKCGRYIEIWNDVFMEYNKMPDGSYQPLQKRNVDTGLGLERTLQVVNGLDSLYQIKLFAPLTQIIKQESTTYDEKSGRIIADHIKAAVFIMADGVQPSNLEQGYVVRRLIRKAFRLSKQMGIEKAILSLIARKIIELYSNAYPHLVENEKKVIDSLDIEVHKFSKTLDTGLKLFQKELNRRGASGFSGQVAFDLYQTYGFPKELIEEELHAQNVVLDNQAWQAAEQAHKNLSRKGAAKKFAGGLADHSEQVVRLHTATHLLHQALREVLGNQVEQKGSNITAKRLRFDFSYPQKMTINQIREVEKIVNEKIQASLPVEKRTMSVDEAKKLGAIGLFGEKYGETVSVFSIGDYSKEICGGPHVKNTKEIGKFTIIKEEASSAGVRRIKAMME